MEKGGGSWGFNWTSSSERKNMDEFDQAGTSISRGTESCRKEMAKRNLWLGVRLHEHKETSFHSLTNIH